MPVGLQSTGRGHAEYITWMREMGGFPISEWEVYKHKWLDNGDSDSDDKNRAAGDGGTANSWRLDLWCCDRSLQLSVGSDL